MFRLQQLGLLLCLIIVMMFVLSACAEQVSDESLQDNFKGSERIVEKEMVFDGVAWTGISVGKEIALVNEDMFSEYSYELWKKDEKGVSLLVENFPMNFLNKIDWEIKDNVIAVSYYVGGIEGGLDSDIVYDDQGSELLRVEGEVPKNYEFSFIQNETDDPYQVTLITEESCGAMESVSVDEAPEVMVAGVRIAHAGVEEEFLLDDPIEVQCEFYDGWIDPLMERGELSEEGIKFILPNGQAGVINLNAEGVSGVEFL